MALTDLLNANREFLLPWEPRRPESYFSLDGQSIAIQNALEQHQNGASLPL